MFIVEIFDGTEWKQASSHTQQVDAESQQARFIDSGSATLETIRMREVEN